MDNIDWGLIASGMPTPVMTPFQERFAGAGVLPAPVIPPSPIAPEALAKNFAARGVPPPPVDVQPEPIRMPDNNVGSSTWRQDFDLANNVTGPGSVGAALTGQTTTGGPSVGAPMDITSQAQKVPTDVSAQTKPEEKDKLAETLKGVKAPAGPELQRLGTPAAPRPTTQIKGGDIIALLQALGGGAGGNEYKLPSTLGAALRK